MLPSDRQYTEYVCQVGHRYSTWSLLVAKEREVEAALWSAAVLLEHVQDIYDRLSLEMVQPSKADRKRITQRIQEARDQKSRLVRLIETSHVWS